ncbi:hypothetical protein LEP1GSC052_4009 [Leptospira kmetyi serovar Malaysia str. Bejo-Iso9]|nr:hypothetical protein LEP1GSC052_4009 [Leptospira kmetyi serovar Malaysia str. Bejo-Iso9]
MQLSHQKEPLYFFDPKSSDFSVKAKKRNRFLARNGKRY